ncbi:hypothetical protein ACSBPQ_12280 [Stenotrophomonas sp. JC08]|uniref:hypothetical protein n=1 Tax=Stenotrophomonas sp. JC08 TaxID=3445779 RepID=UPI003FA2D978
MLNKKILVAAIVGGLFAGNAAAVDFTSGNATTIAGTVGKYAQEIKTGSTSASATTFAAASGTEIKWLSGYAYSPNEVRYIRVEAPSHVLFQSFTPTATGGTGALTPGAVNGVGTNVITFSITAGAAGAGGNVVITLPAAVKLTSIADANVTVSLYDQPSQAQAGGDTGKISGGSVSGKYLTFAPSLKWVGTPGTATADVNATNGSYTQFTGGVAVATLNAGLGIDVTGTLKAVGTAIAVTDLLDNSADATTVSIAGDFSLARSSGNAPYNGAAAARVVGFGGGALDLAADEAVFDLSNGLSGNFVITKLTGTGTAWNPVIWASAYTASLNAVNADSSTYSLATLADTNVGEIIRNGTNLQAPLVQVPDGWLSRLVLTNTSAAARNYTISLMSEEGVTLTAGTLTGVIPANGTKVIDDLRTVFTGSNRATLNVDVAGPNDKIQGLYQIVNPTSGSISNHVLVRPASN